MRLGIGGTATARATQITATTGQQTLTLAPGNYQLVVVGFSANSFSIARIPTQVE
jgi:hypothetical protein